MNPAASRSMNSVGEKTRNRHHRRDESATVAYRRSWRRFAPDCTVFRSSCVWRGQLILEPSLNAAWRRSAAASRADAADPRAPPAPSVTHTGREGHSRLRTWPGAARVADRRCPILQFTAFATRHVIIDGRTRRDLTFHPTWGQRPCEIAAVTWQPPLRMDAADTPILLHGLHLPFLPLWVIVMNRFGVKCGSKKQRDFW